ncbi:hypothetical protein [Bradyrhizobium brasilense]|uniref:hypothetical protein n=2 Tax=Nitrobacteraceae TaxID=41294 RepID=UPI00115FFF1E|nr:hypothetical protein [Bradyrhizobium brasilense]MCC8974481.1 hypothetical protein [Bradyrhizobium brasilense]
MKQITCAALFLRQVRGNDPADSGLSTLTQDTAAMAREFQTARSRLGRADGMDRRWLAALVDAMEQAARPEVRNVPCDASLISAAAAHLARPAPTFGHCGSAYSLRN